MLVDADSFPNDPASPGQTLPALFAENDKLLLLLQRLGRHQFGRRSKQTGAQLQLSLQDPEQIVVGNQPRRDAAQSCVDRKPKPGAARSVRNHGALPSQLPMNAELMGWLPRSDMEPPDEPD